MQRDHYNATSSISMLIGLWSSFELKLFLDHETDAINGEAIQSSSSGIGQQKTGWCASGVNEVSCQDGSQDSTHDQNHWHLTAPTGSTADGVAAAAAAASATTSAICNYLFMPALTLALGISKLLFPARMYLGAEKYAGHGGWPRQFGCLLRNDKSITDSGIPGWLGGAPGGTTNCVRRHKDKEEDGTTFKANRADVAIKRTRCTARVKVSRSWRRDAKLQRPDKTLRSAVALWATRTTDILQQVLPN